MSTRSVIRNIKGTNLALKSQLKLMDELYSEYDKKNGELRSQLKELKIELEASKMTASILDKKFRSLEANKQI